MRPRKTRRAEVRERVEEQRDRRCHRLDEDSGDGRPGDEGQRAAEAHLAVGVDDVPPRDDTDEERRPADVEHDREGPDSERDGVELGEAEHVERVGHRHRGEQQRPTDVGHDHELPPRLQPFDPDAGEEREEQVRHQLRGDEEAHLGRGRVQREDGDEREGQQRDLVAEHGDRLRRPELPELGLPE